MAALSLDKDNISVGQRQIYIVCQTRKATVYNKDRHMLHIKQGETTVYDKGRDHD